MCILLAMQSFIFMIFFGAMNIVGNAVKVYAICRVNETSDNTLNILQTYTNFFTFFCICIITGYAVGLGDWWLSIIGSLNLIVLFAQIVIETNHRYRYIASISEFLQSKMRVLL